MSVFKSMSVTVARQVPGGNILCRVSPQLHRQGLICLGIALLIVWIGLVIALQW